ncbi:P-loop NTPase fold protein [Asticcacaulis benevestitus]|uniref:KAP NTPase domain-containing protein n=1 Tax=Asticcacaulis benevestitus DSM 16100 = ATCC BAA-896 TaxID=1121022 RepID=V4NV72_9CAUL|nr:P-loop NTPase fold protein [Asticcacaulis benevestitus]ESQ78884.1 hypothetical protein ABENE_22985 [Asticcacaulis benevestitus DSM 16100 = ATCC BAA-896]
MDSNNHLSGPQSVRFIRDTAAEDDFFGTHSKIGAAIAEAIQSNDNLKVIGLLGAWGSGKSTVIKQIEKHLPDADQINTTLFFTYDAWLNQSDHPRRSFLEALLRFLMENGLSKDNTWEDQLATLNGQIEETETTTSPVLTPSGALVLISFLCVPIGMQFFGYDALKDYLGDENKVQGTWAFFSGLTLILAPALVSSLIYLYRRPVRCPLRKSFWNPKNWTKNRKGHEKQSVMSLFANKAIEKQLNRTTREPEPSAIEFQKLFGDILSEIARTGQRIILVIDNLDRLPETEGIAMWTTIRSFFLGTNQSTEHYQKLPVILLPVDQDAVTRLYGDQAQSFMDKTFDLTFRVTAPVQSEWKAYLHKRMKAVFGSETPEQWVYHAARLFERSRQMGENITPRSINVTINAIATLWLQRRNDGIEFASIAYYTIFRVWADRSIIDAIRSPNLHLVDLDPDWARALAALHYGVTLEMAFQVLIEDQLRSGLTTTTQEHFGKLAEAKGFGDAFLNLIENAGLTPMASLPINASILLASLEPADALWIGTAWLNLRRQLVTSTNFDKPDANSLQAVQVLLKFGGPKGMRPFIEGMVQKVSNLSATTAFSAEHAQVFIDLVGELTSSAESNGFDAPSFVINADANGFWELCVLACDRPQILTALSTKLRSEDLIVELVRNLETPEGWEKIIPRFKAAVLRSDINHWGPLIDAARNLVWSNDGRHPPMAAALYILGTLSVEDQIAIEAMQSLARDGHLQQRVQELMSGPEATLAMVAALGVIFGPPFPLRGDWGQALVQIPSLPEATERAFAQFKLEDNLTHLLAASFDIPEFLPLSRNLITRRVRSGKLIIADIGKVLDNLDHFLGCVEPAYHRKAVILMSQTFGFWAKIESMAFSANWVHILRTLLEADEVLESDREQAVRVSKNGLQWLTDHDWEDTLRGNSQALELGQKVFQIRNESILAPGTDLDGVLDRLMTEVLQDGQRPLIKRWFYASNLLSVSARITKLQTLRDRFNGAPLHIINQIIDVGGEAFLRDAQFLADADAATRRVIIPQLASTTDARRLLNHPAIFAAWVKASTEATRNYLQEQLNVIYGTAPSEDQKMLREVAKKLKVRLLS